MKMPIPRLPSTRRFRIGLAVIAAAVPAMADAPPTQYDRFGREAAEITDSSTRLVWDRRRVQKEVERFAGQIYCNQTVFPGVGRLPTVKELLTLVDEDRHEEYDTAFNPPIVLTSIDALAFPNTPADRPYWTSTPAPAGRYWTVDFSTGKTEPRDPTSKLHVRCVR